ncbi:MAG: hypothetical protein ACP5E9_10545 [Candidatus Methanospirareceae archaeon]
MKVVSNSTPLIALSRIHKFSLLKEYFGAVFIPKEVYEEVVTPDAIEVAERQHFARYPYGAKFF